MANFIGTAFNDNYVGGADDDFFDMSQGGDDTVDGGAGDDFFYFGAAFTADDRIDGGTDNFASDTLELNGNYTAGVVLAADTIKNIELIELDKGDGVSNSYSLTMNDGNVAADQLLFILGRQLTAAETITFNGSAETDGSFELLSGDSADTFQGGAQGDFVRSGGGNDTLFGNAGNDYLNGEAGDDYMDGGAGIDRVSFYDSRNAFTSGVTVSLMLQGTAQNTGHGIDTFVNFENLSGDQYDDTLTGDNNANFIWGENDPTTSGLVANNDTLYGLGGDDLLQVGLGDNLLNGGGGTDTASIYYTNAGVTVSLALQGAAQDTGQGNMTLVAMENLFGSPYADTLTGDRHDNVIGGDDGNDTLNGGKGNDTLYGDGVATIDDTRGFSGPIVIRPEGADAGIGATKNDTLNGGAGDDVLVGGAGSDSLNGAGGNDRFVYLAVSDSAPGSEDAIHHLNNADVIDLSAIDADTTAPGDQAFTLVSSFTGAAGQLTLAFDHHTHVTVLSGDVDGDGVADFVVNIDGNHAHFSNFDL